MEIGPIFRALLHSKTRFVLIVTEIALTLAIVANCFNMIGDYREKIDRPTGIDVDHVLVVTSLPIAPEFQEKDYQRSVFQEDLRALRAMPGVIAASAAHQIPLSGGGSSTGRVLPGKKMDPITTPYFAVAPDFLEAMGVDLTEGRALVDSDYPDPAEEDKEKREEDGATATRNIILTRSLADKFYPDGDALGKTITNSDGGTLDRIVGIVGVMKNSWPQSSIPNDAMLLPIEPFNARRTRYVVRAEPSMVDTLYTGLEDKLVALNPGRIIRIRTMSEIKTEQFRELSAINKMLGAISILLVSVTALGIVGLTSFSVTQRTRQIGTRRALGASRAAILRYFLVENWVITTSGLTLGVLLTYALNFALAKIADLPIMSPSLMAGVMLVLWATGLAAALAPAVRGTAVSPALATRSV